MVSGSLLVCRGAVGAALGGLLPASFAILRDMYPADERPHAIAMMAVARQHLPAWQDPFDTARFNMVHFNGKTRGARGLCGVGKIDLR